MTEPWVGFKGDHLRVNYEFEFLCRQGTKLRRDHHVHLSVTLQDGDVLVAAGRLQESNRSQFTSGGGGSERVSQSGSKPYRREAPVKRKPAAEGHHAGQLMLAGQSGVQGQGATLRLRGGRTAKPSLEAAPV